MKITVTTPQIYPIIVPTESSLISYNFYLIHHQDDFFLVDAGVDSDTCWDYFNQALEEVDMKITDLDGIILTHNHADHIGLVNRIRTLHELPVYAHPNAWVRLKRDPAFLEARISFYENLYEKMDCGLEAEQQLEQLRQSIIQNQSQKIMGDITPLHKGTEIYGFQVIEVLGHAPDHIALFHEKSGILLAGDHIIEHMSSNALVEIGMNGEQLPSLKMYEHSLKTVSKLPVHTVYAGHGNIIRSPHDVIDQKIKRIERKADRLLGLLEEPRTGAELAKLIYKDKYDTLFPLVMSEVIGHLDRLENLQKITKELRKNVYFYVTIRK